MVVFPTRFKKAKISSRLSWPVGAELISAELVDVPQAANFEIAFSSKYETMETRGEPYEILTVGYTSFGIHDSDWKIRVGPVSRECKHSAREALKAEFFPRIRQWLEARADWDNKQVGSCGVIFDEKHDPMLKWRD